MTARTINARHAGTCRCSRQFALGARITVDQHKRVISCYDCTTARKTETTRRLNAAIDALDAIRRQK
jgi:3-deoxy-D-arabino-heptulosonate 7-phosphate (DAHP) synthase